MLIVIGYADKYGRVYAKAKVYARVNVLQLVYFVIGNCPYCDIRENFAAGAGCKA